MKICGITTPEDAAMVCAAGADAIGLVFWPRSPRHVDLPRAKVIASQVPPLVLRVGVFVDATREELERTADLVGLDILQLHGSEAPESCATLPRRVVKAVRVGPGFDPEEALRYRGVVSGILLDTRAPEAPGGTGQAFDWSLARRVREGVPYLVLAGGLTPENVVAAARALRPDAVDASSGVEVAPGRKDPAKVRAFMEAVRSVS